MKYALFIVAILILVITTPIINYLWFGSLWRAIAIEDTGVFNSEDEAAYSGSPGIKTSPAILTVSKGESVAVLWDTHGKDYWACYIRTETEVRGWVLCTSFKKTS
jgi:hypothetical protein